MSLNDVQQRLLTLDDVASRMGVSRRTVERRVAAGEIPALQLGGPRTPIRVDAVELDAWLRSPVQDAGASSSPAEPPAERRELDSPVGSAGDRAVGSSAGDS